MVLELLLVVLIVSFCLYADKSHIIKLFILLLPFHLILKNGLFYFYHGGGLFAFWKEVAVLILVYKTFKSTKFKINKDVFYVLSLFVMVVVTYFFLSKDFMDGLSQLRDHLFTILLFIAIYHCSFNIKQIRGMFLIFVLGAFISCIGGFLQLFAFKELIGTIKGSIDFIDSSGYIQYKTVSARIMGIERMSGLFSGPNDFGLYISFSLCICVFMLFSGNFFYDSKKIKLFIQITMVMLMICLLLSFSRAGWAIFVITNAYLFFMGKVNFNMKIILSAILAFCLLILSIFYFVPEAYNVVEASVSGKEASAAARGSILQRGIETILSEPFGHGLGTTYSRTGNKVEFFVESAFLNITYEIGVLGLLLLLLLHIMILLQILKLTNSKGSLFSSLSIGLCLAALIASFVSINTYGMPFIYLWWLILGLGMNKIKDVVLNSENNEVLHRNSYI